VRVEDRYDTDIDDLWSALTDPGRLVRWYGQVEGDLRLGGAVPPARGRRRRGRHRARGSVRAAAAAAGDDQLATLHRTWIIVRRALPVRGSQRALAEQPGPDPGDCAGTSLLRETGRDRP